jgi:hypothetical protein
MKEKAPSLIIFEPCQTHWLIRKKESKIEEMLEGATIGVD